MKLSLVICLACLATGFGSYLSRRAVYNPYRPSRWVPRAFWNPEKRGGIGSLGGLRSFLASRPARGGHVYHVGQLMGKRDQGLEDYTATEEDNPFLDDTYQELEDLKEKRRSFGSKYADNKSYGFWISALNKAGNIKRSPDLADEIPKVDEPGLESNY